MRTSLKLSVVQHRRPESDVIIIANSQSIIRQVQVGCQIAAIKVLHEGFSEERALTSQLATTVSVGFCRSNVCSVVTLQLNGLFDVSSEATCSICELTAKMTSATVSPSMDFSMVESSDSGLNRKPD